MVKKVIYTLTAFFMLLSLTTPASAIGTNGVYHHYHIADHGTWYDHGHATRASFTSNFIPFGLVVWNSKGAHNRVLGHVYFSAHWTEVGLRNSGIAASATVWFSVPTKVVSLRGALYNGKNNVKSGGTKIGKNCRSHVWPHGLPPLFEENSHIFCARHDYNNYDHNMLTEVVWSMEGHRGEWYCYVRTPVSHRAVGGAKWWFRPATSQLALAGQNGDKYTQTHMKCGSTVADVFE